MIFAYKTTNKQNNKYYVGIHKGSIDDNYLGSGKALKRAIEKYGKENFDREILCEFETLEEAYSYEASIVDQQFVDDPQTYNMTLGGNGGWYHCKDLPNPMMSYETRQKVSVGVKKAFIENPSLKEISKRNLAISHKNQKGKPLSEETKSKISKSNKGRVSPQKGKVLSEETKSKMSNAWSEDMKENKSVWMKERIKNNPDIVKTNLGKTFSEETKFKMSAAAKKSWETREIHICKYCGTSSKSASNIKRWHNENCRNRG